MEPSTVFKIATTVGEFEQIHQLWDAWKAKPAERAHAVALRKHRSAA